MQCILIILFVIFACLMWREGNIKVVKKDNKILFFFLVLSLVAAFRPDTLRDYYEYRDVFLTGEDNGHFELGFLLFTNVIRTLTSQVWLYFFIIALISVGLKIWCIKKITPFVYASVLVFVSTIYILQDLIAIRAAIASGLGLMALYYKNKGNWKKFLVLILLGTLVHTSAVLFLPLWFLKYGKYPTFFCFFGILFSYFLAIKGFTFGYILELVNLDYVQRMLTYYTSQEDVPTNLYGVKHLLNVAICIFLLFKAKYINRVQPGSSLYIYTYSISIIIFFLFSDIPVISFRASELYQVSLIICLPYVLHIYRKRKKRFIGYLIVTIFSFCQLYLSVFYSKLLS